MEPLHEWDVTPDEAVEIQKALRSRVSLVPARRLADIRTVAGIDALYSDVSRAAVVVLSFPELEVVERAVAIRDSVFPYVPGLLSFREVPAVLDALARLRTPPDVLMCDGQGYAHPRRLGLATHLGVYLNRPSVGCAKSRLVGTYAEPGQRVGDRSPLVHRGETVGMVVRSKPRTNPLFVSPGHLMDVETSVELVLACLRGYRLPEPTRLADKLSREA
jgi:deoxyribonuclease V